MQKCRKINVIKPMQKQKETSENKCPNLNGKKVNPISKCRRVKFMRKDCGTFLKMIELFQRTQCLLSSTSTLCLTMKKFNIV